MQTSDDICPEPLVTEIAHSPIAVFATGKRSETFDPSIYRNAPEVCFLDL